MYGKELLFTMLCKAVLPSESVNEILNLDHSVASESYLSRTVRWCCLQFLHGSYLVSVDEIFKCDYSNESY